MWLISSEMSLGSAAASAAASAVVIPELATAKISAGPMSSGLGGTRTRLASLSAHFT